MIPPRRTLAGLWPLILVCAWATAASGATTVFREGRAEVSVFVAQDAAPDEREAAEELTRVLGVMSGLEWRVLAEPAADEPAGIYVGRTRAGAAREPPLRAGSDLLAPAAGETGPDAFRIRARDGRVFIEGATPEATYFAVAWLLQNEAGVRWYTPGPDGEAIPRRSEWTLPDLHATQQPAYLSRELYDLGTPEGAAWARRNGLRGRLDFNHALNRVFTPEILRREPEWASELRGRRHIPATEADHEWQPNLARPGVAAHAAAAAVAAFAADPERASFSLAMNDNVRFDQSAATRALVEPLRTFRGMPDYSPLVFTFMNRAAEAMAPSAPGRYLGCLAYFWCENPPPFPVNAQIVPYVTTDRSQYYDPAYRAEDFALMSRWGGSGARAFGLWEYAFGGNFLVPRLPLGALADGVREGWHRGARGYFAEVGAQWGFDAFKVWMLARLLWAPDLDPAALADDFYRGYYGAAGEPMRRFATRCEALWMAQPGPPYWLKFYRQEDQAMLFPAEARAELGLILAEAARVVSGDPKIAARVERSASAFRVTEAYAGFDDERRRLADIKDGDVKSESDLGESIRRLIECKSALFRAYAEATRGDLPAMSGFALTPFLRNDPVPRLLWLAGLREPGAPRRILDAAGAPAAGEEMWRALAETWAGGGWTGARNLAANPDFSVSAGTGQEPAFLFPRGGILPAGWEVLATPSETGRVARVAAGPLARALRIEGGWDTQVFQWVPAEPGRVYAATARLRGNSEPGGDAGLFLSFLTKYGAVVGTHRMQGLPKGPTPEWRTFALADIAPDGAAWVGVGVCASRQTKSDWLEAASVELRGATREGGL